MSNPDRRTYLRCRPRSASRSHSSRSGEAGRASAASGSSIFALAYDTRTTTAARTELGAWFDWNIAVDYGTTLVLRTRAVR